MTPEVTKLPVGKLRRSVSGTITLYIVLAAGPGVANASDLASAPPLAVFSPAWEWTGGYFGTHLGAAWGETDFTDPFGPSLYGDKVRTPGFLGGIQTGYNWQAPNTRLVLGVEADVSALSSNGTNTCLAFSGFFLSANCRSGPNASATLTGRAGIAVDPAQRTLLYLKGGLGLVHENVAISTNPILDPGFATSSSLWNWGWTFGVGVERALTPAWSLRLEYDDFVLGSRSVAAPASFFQVIPGDPFGYVPIAASKTGLSANLQEVKFGLNYRINADPWAGWSASAPPLAAFQPPAVLSWLGGWQFEGGGRYWMSWGRFQKDLGAGTTNLGTANVLNSRLTYDTTANSGELFVRVEGPEKIFLKGFIGAGDLSGGKMNDEDWGAFSAIIPYSNTISDTVKGKIAYATVDAGYDVLRAPSYRLGVFVGYNYLQDNKDAYGCAQIANQLSDCATPVPSSVLTISEDDTWNSLRVGVNAEMLLFPGLTLAADVAYLPLTQFNGRDIHWLRTDVPSPLSPEAGRGSGVQLEAIASYFITPSFSVGVGGRYWAMWTNDNAFTNIFGTACPCQTLPVKTERYGILVQADYKFDVAASLVAGN